jgi:hypothetical protein
MIETDIKIYDRISTGIGCPGFRRDCVEGTQASLVARGAARQQSSLSYDHGQGEGRQID